MFEFKSVWSNFVEYLRVYEFGETDQILPCGTHYEYAGSYLVTAFYNTVRRHAVRVRSWALARYNAWEDEYDQDFRYYRNKKWTTVDADQSDLTFHDVFVILTNKELHSPTHLDINFIYMDVRQLLLLPNGVYWEFWKDMDSSDCSLGRFTMPAGHDVDMVFEAFDREVKNATHINYLGDPRLVPDHVC